MPKSSPRIESVHRLADSSPERAMSQPTLTGREAIATRPGRIDQYRGEALDPADQSHVVNVDTAFGKKFFEVAIRQAVQRYQRTASMITSGGNRNLANADHGWATIGAR